MKMMCRGEQRTYVCQSELGGVEEPTYSRKDGSPSLQNPEYFVRAGNKPSSQEKQTSNPKGAWRPG